MYTDKKTGFLFYAYTIVCMCFIFFFTSTSFVSAQSTTTPAEVGSPFYPVQEFKPLVGIPGLPTNSANIENLLNALYILAIVGGALIAVLRITWAGVRYMSTDIVSGKGEALEEIKSSLLGLLLILSTALILRTIFGEINMNVLSVAPNLTLTPAPPIQGGVGGADRARIQPALGCSQTGSGSGRECTGGTVAAIGAAEVRCQARVDGRLQAYAEHPSFRPVTESECRGSESETNPNENADNVIIGGGRIYGLHEVTERTMGNLEEYRARIQRECEAMGGNNLIEQRRTPIFSANTRQFLCVSS